jgi:hypothetical protein
MNFHEIGRISKFDNLPIEEGGKWNGKNSNNFFVAFNFRHSRQPSSQRISCPAIVDVGEKIQLLQREMLRDGHQQAAIIPTNLVPLRIRGCFPSRRTLLP